MVVLLDKVEVSVKLSAGLNIGSVVFIKVGVILSYMLTSREFVVLWTYCGFANVCPDDSHAHRGPQFTVV